MDIQLKKNSVIIHSTFELHLALPVINLLHVKKNFS